jgi:single-strand DNA-binding protein
MIDNDVKLHGRLGADPELRYTQSGIPVCNARLCTSYRRKSKDGSRQETTTWHQLVIWQSRGEAFAKYLKKGSEVLVSGHIQNSSYEDREGIKRYKSEVVVEDWAFCGSKKDSDSQNDDDRPRAASSSQRAAPKPAQTDVPAGADSGESFPDDFGDGSDIPFN